MAGGRIPIGSALIMIGTITGIGYGIMALTTPSEKQFYDQLAPDLKKKVDDSRAFQAEARAKADRLAAINAAAQGDTPIWADSLDDPNKKKKE